MWTVERTIGDEKLFRCSECGFQLVGTTPPDECPNCGEYAPYKLRSIDLNKSNIHISDTEVPVYQYERDTPAYKLWYFWVILIISAVLISGILMVLQNTININVPENAVQLEKIYYVPPTGWTKKDDKTYSSPGDGAEIKFKVYDVSIFDNVDEFGKLISDLTNIEDIEEKNVNGIDLRYLSWKTRKIVEEEEIFTDYARYAFVYKGKLYLIMYVSQDDSPEVFETFINSLTKG